DAGDSAQGIALCEETLRLARKHAYVDQICRALNMIGAAHSATGNFELARSFFEESLQVCRDWGDRHSIAMVACNLADVYMLRGQVAPASYLVLEALDQSFKTKSKSTMYRPLPTATLLAVAAHDWEPAALMLGAMDAARK